MIINDRSMELATRLEHFGFDRFIKLNLPYLADKTIKTLEVAGKLNADFNQKFTIMNHPEIRGKNKSLYNYIMEKSSGVTAQDFLKVLQMTSNTQVIQFLENKLSFNPQDSSFLSGAATHSNAAEAHDVGEPVEKGIRFNIQEPVESFCGRIQFLEKLHETIHSTKKVTEIVVISQVNVTSWSSYTVAGLGGIGKTETARKYISMYDNCYENIIWIEGETRATIENSFNQLAVEYLGVSPNEMSSSQSKSKVDMTQIVTSFYAKICEKGHPENTLIIFDNVDVKQAQPIPQYSGSSTNTSPLSSASSASPSSSNYSPVTQNHGVAAVQSFLPSSFLPSNVKRPKVLITSANKLWHSSMGKIRIMELNTLSVDEGIKFVLTELGMIDCPENRNEARGLTYLLGGHPLTLRIAVAFIRQQQQQDLDYSQRRTSNCVRSHSRSYSISDYIKLINKAKAKMNGNSSIPRLSIYSSWSTVVEQLEKIPHGDLAIKMSEFLALLYADHVPVDFLLSLQPKSEVDNVNKGLELLEKYGVIDIIHPSQKSKSYLKSSDKSFSTTTNNNNEDSSAPYIRIHRLLQYTIVRSLRTSSKLVERLKELFNKFRFILQKYEEIGSDDIIFLSIQQIIVDDPFNLINETNKFINFVVKYARFLRSCGKYDDCMDLFRRIENKRTEILGPSGQRENFETQNDMALVYVMEGKYEEALRMYDAIEWHQTVHLTAQDPDTITTAFNTAVTHRMMKNYPKAFEKIQEVLDIRKKVLGPNHKETIKAESELAYIFYLSGDFTNALRHYEQVYEKQSQGTDVASQGDLVKSQYFQAMSLLKQRRLSEATNIFQEIHRALVNNLGKNDPETLNIEHYIGVVLERQGRLKESRRTLMKVYERQRQVFGDSHSDTMNSRDWLLYLDERLQQLH